PFRPSPVRLARWRGAAHGVVDQPRRSRRRGAWLQEYRNRSNNEPPPSAWKILIYSGGRTAWASESRLARPVRWAILFLDTPLKRSVNFGDLFRGLGLGRR